MDEPSAQALDELNAILRQALPEAWQHDPETAIFPEGFTFRFRDAEGRQHALDVRGLEQLPTALVTGTALGYSYTSLDPSLDEAAVLDDYRAVLTALAAREEDLLRWMPEPEAPVENTALPFRGPQPGERPAPAELVAVVRAELPEAWHRELSVSLTQGGFVLQFVDEAGVRHALDAREISPEAPTLVSGRVLAFSYLFIEGGVEETAQAGEYRAVLSRLASREDAILPWLDATPPPADVAAPVNEEAATALPDEHPAPPELAAILREALPEAWRHEVTATLSPSGFLLRFRDAEGRQHALDARELRLAPSVLVSGQSLGYSYTLVDPALDEAAVLDGYRAALTAISLREDDLLPWLSFSPDEAEGLPTAVASGHTWKGPLPNERPAPAELVAVVSAELPEAWRHELSVSLTQGGFVLQFVDEAGVHHALDAREISPEAPTLVSGRVLAFSYLFIEGGVEETAQAGEYRAVLSRLASREDAILPWLDATPPPPDVAAPVSEEAATAFPNENPAPPEFAAILREALPEAWRHEVTATLSPSGFLLRFRDAEGRQHALDARELHLAPSTLVSGRSLGYSYTLVDPALDEAAVLDGYRAALTAISLREDDLLPWLSLASMKAPAYYPSEPPNDPLVRPAAPELGAIVAEALPAAWRRDLDVTLTTHGFVARLRDEQDAWHTLYVHEIHPDAPALLTGKALAYAYLLLDGQADDAARAGQYRAVLQGLLDREERILPWLQEDQPARPASPGLLALVDELLPAPWRSDVAVVLGFDGFTLGFRDGGGVRHMLEIRLLSSGRPALVRGEQLGFAYRKVDAALDETVMVQRYREALLGFVAREQQLVTRMQETA